MDLDVAARGSALSRAQVKEVAEAMPHICFHVHYVETLGDLDQKTSLRSLGKSDFFTKEIDKMLLQKKCRIAIHSAKDLPDPLPEGLKMVALTRGVDSSDSLVFHQPLPKGALVGTSCERRDLMVKAFRSDLQCVDIRGTIEKRLQLLDEGKVQGVVIAEAALIRLGLIHLQRIRLKGETAPWQGKLAILARAEDSEMQELFASLDIRQRKVLYLGLDASHYRDFGRVTHHPIIRLVPKKAILPSLDLFTHIIFTSQAAVRFFLELFPSLQGKTIIAIGKQTANFLISRKVKVSSVAEEETQEGIIALLETLDLKNARILLPRSLRARTVIDDYLRLREVPFEVISLYEPLPNEQPLPDLNHFDEIYFTSPSTVEAFFKMNPLVPAKIAFKAIGPVTSNALHSMIRTLV